MARSPNPVTRLYEIRAGKSGWARIWITDDGCITILSDYGNYGYWFGAPDCEFRKFLTDCDDDYLGSKFANGRQVFDGEETVDAIREHILRTRRDKRIDADLARREWDALGTSFDNEVEFAYWLRDTGLGGEFSRYVRPHAIGHFLKQVWPLFMAELRRELAQEAMALVDEDTSARVGIRSSR
jgi:hypothetical protein